MEQARTYGAADYDGHVGHRIDSATAEAKRMSRDGTAVVIAHDTRRGYFVVPQGSQDPAMRVVGRAQDGYVIH